MRRLMGIITFFGVAGAVLSVQAQNLLVNGDLNATPGTVYYDGFDPSIADDVPGWLLSLGAADGSYVLVSPEANPDAGGVDADMGIGPAGGGMETASALRPLVIAGLPYLASVTSDNYFGANTTSYFIDWYNGVGGLISSSGGPLGDPNGPFGYDPYHQLFSISAPAPVGAATAGVRFRSGDGTYNGLAADNFTLSLVPEPGSAALIGSAALGLLAAVQRRRR